MVTVYPRRDNARAVGRALNAYCSRAVPAVAAGQNSR